MNSWYDKNIEEPVRDLVKLLRENGFNTVCSCGHTMYVQCQCIPDGELQRLHNLLFGNYEDYEINILLQCNKGIWYATTTVKMSSKGKNNSVRIMDEPNWDIDGGSGDTPNLPYVEKEI